MSFKVSSIETQFVSVILISKRLRKCDDACYLLDYDSNNNQQLEKAKKTNKSCAMKTRWCEKKLKVKKVLNDHDILKSRNELKTKSHMISANRDQRRCLSITSSVTNEIEDELHERASEIETRKNDEYRFCESSKIFMMKEMTWNDMMLIKMSIHKIILKKSELRS